MKPVLVDTDILSLFFRNHHNVVLNFKNYLTLYEKINLSIITYYEILSGLKHKDALKQLDSFLEFARHNVILPLTEETIIIPSDLYANLRKVGKPIDDIDILIAGGALSNNLVLVTNNEGHFKNIEGLEIQNWSLL
ncbi:VapC toxin family PIN domain ribonuclease [Candidatus Desantisbacteria bacterium CG_4_9_14_3_um_filter_40_11]|uniref:VapC toxin family PIN domain ribonuclease n=4 Tax=unclassified Candidatus Desantisiibacteriota TaxID=3106372 RepID=A0A2M7JDA1_9BACT|nr:MAG: VapC toxin family PIN domain ribonuclease [Candidatus Desantisbacteria bacterium CG23_combo_of_CG06-09_8_20_14_all_40_23]PIX17402.1 MAG: VapC toxin family PIN domain ribonuclease [Candidatus Desantisbacteria bacterium CG_4_8_14_3_um_filter_40_12]PIY20040.1 MAG: VapC toxin family PIN domain ribonuclease [Candidatus Desantisbacteria bacterium CG_4_10_14_3_um_filter_40_18]PJB29205.1 MAG: VapC toxin family PIN domain ribonuclease [Candidatus Desantisbacteria bacterium CG_4_9_14_3_um_filter_4